MWYGVKAASVERWTWRLHRQHGTKPPNADWQRGRPRCWRRHLSHRLLYDQRAGIITILSTYV